MSKLNDKKHILNEKQKEFLTPLQTKILLFLAVNNPLTINETVKAIKGNYRSAWDSFNALEKKELIKKVDIKEYRGRKYDRLWLTENGILFAMSQEIKPDTLFRKSQEVYPESKDLHCLLEILPVLGTQNINKMLYLTVINKGKIDPNDLISIFTQQKKPSTIDIKRYNSILKKYPERYKQHKEVINQASKNLKELSEMFDA